jgi:hypothetical protein
MHWNSFLDVSLPLLRGVAYSNPLSVLATHWVSGLVMVDGVEGNRWDNYLRVVNELITHQSGAMLCEQVRASLRAYELTSLQKRACYSSFLKYKT